MFCLVPVEIDWPGPGHSDPPQPNPGQDRPKLPVVLEAQGIEHDKAM